ncbi:MoaD/ThiS family protein [Candidatus Bathyarchaeota archaeon]|nr:MoaD/ThiS family protein [Candidatus Bathyarchaeota archaeon]MBL7167476.1 MoaD/ThiS family protein [Candidatus Bathyarchaeota archaeon]
MAKVDVRLYAALRRYVHQLGLGEAIELDLDEGATIRHIFERLGLPEAEVKRVFVNGLSRGYEHILSEGDRVAIFPPVAGG